ncbi:hypothetical protein BLOT_008885 [Blomia tropicalis]|nr:hypothetical protein BLOT_008885 [Blomia tropicalis]
MNKSKVWRFVFVQNPIFISNQSTHHGQHFVGYMSIVLTGIIIGQWMQWSNVICISQSSMSEVNHQRIESAKS